MLTTTGAAVTGKLNDYTDIDIANSHSATQVYIAKGYRSLLFPFFQIAVLKWPCFYGLSQFIRDENNLNFRSDLWFVLY